MGETVTGSGAAPRRVMVTGGDGFLGWHLRCRLHSDPGIVLTSVARSQFEDAGALAETVRNADVVYHLAGINRAPEEELRNGNRRLAELLCTALDHAGARPVIVYANSTHAATNSAYGAGKRAAGEALREWCAARGSSFVDCIFPHLFGEGARPHYNSAVATFCRQLADGVEPRIDPRGEVELLHAQDACDLMVSASLGGSASTVLQPAGRRLGIAEVAARLAAIRDSYAQQLIPDLSDALNLRLFNTFRSYLFPDRAVRPLLVHRDARGHLFEAVRGGGGGQSFVSWTQQGVTRGNHYHRHKVERFLVLEGRAVIRIRRLLDAVVSEFSVSGAEPVCIDMPTLHTHSICNVGDRELITLFWAHEIFDPARPDTYVERV